MWLCGKYQLIFNAMADPLSGAQFMVPSVRNAEAGHLHVLKNAECTKLFHSAEFTKTASQLQSKKPELETFELGTLEELLSAPPKHYPYHKQWATSWKEPIIIAHSSGSTGKSVAKVTMDSYLT